MGLDKALVLMLQLWHNWSQYLFFLENKRYYEENPRIILLHIPFSSEMQ